MKRMKVLAIVMIFAFAALGGAYAALWKDTVVLKTTVNTGKVALKWVNPNVGDDYHAGSPYALKDGEDSVAKTLNDGSSNPNAGDYPYPPGIRRDVAHIELVSADEKTLTVQIDNAYPDYQGEIEAEILNAGTIPVVINNIVATDQWGNALPNWLNYEIRVVPDDVDYSDMENVLPAYPPLLGTLLEASNSDGSIHNTVDSDSSTTTNPNGWEPADNKVKVRISIHVAGATDIKVPQLATQTLKISIDGTQWNGVYRGDTPTTLDLPNNIVNRFN